MHTCFLLLSHHFCIQKLPPVPDLVLELVSFKLLASKNF
jgi:hypothetical protein